MKHDERAIVAAANNADLYEAMFQAWGLRYDRASYAFTSLDEPPPYYSHLTVLAPGQATSIVAHLRDAVSGGPAAVSFKDSFCDVGPHVSGFQPLFEAFWLWRDADASLPDPRWETIEDEVELARWERAWKRAGSPTASHMFRPALLQSASVTLLGKKKDDVLVSGCIANVSPTCIGISNVFSVEQGDRAFQEAAAAIASISGGRPIVGYCANNFFEAAEQVGFTRTGSLKVLHSNAVSK